MRFENLENNLMNKKYRKDESERLHRRLQEIKTRKPIFTRIENVPILPIIQSSKVARANKQRRIEKENEKMVNRIEHIIKNARSEYSYYSTTERAHHSLSPSSRQKKLAEQTQRKYQGKEA